MNTYRPEAAPSPKPPSRIPTALTSLFVMAALAGCGGGGSDAPSATPSAALPTAPTPAPAPAPTPAPAPAPTPAPALAPAPAPAPAPTPTPTPAPATRSLTRITVNPGFQLTGSSVAATMNTSEDGNVKAIGTYSDGTTTDITDAVTWSSSNVEAATVSAGGNVNGYITALGQLILPAFPLGISSADTLIKATDPTTRTEQTLLLTVNRQYDEGTSNIPLRVGLLVGGVPPSTSVPGRNSYVSTSLPGSWYVAKLDPGRYYAVSIYDQSAQISLFARGQPADGGVFNYCSETSSFTPTAQGPIGCIARADTSGNIAITVAAPNGPIRAAGGTAVNYRLNVVELLNAPFATVGTLSAPVVIAPNAFLSAGYGKCSYYTYNTSGTTLALTLKNIASRTTTTITVAGMRYTHIPNGIEDKSFSIPMLGTTLVEIKFCDDLGASWFGSTAQITSP